MNVVVPQNKGISVILFSMTFVIKLRTYIILITYYCVTKDNKLDVLPSKNQAFCCKLIKPVNVLPFTVKE